MVSQTQISSSDSSKFPSLQDEIKHLHEIIKKMQDRITELETNNGFQATEW